MDAQQSGQPGEWVEPEPEAETVSMRRCASCQREARTPNEVADLQVVWLVDRGDGTPTRRRFCNMCRPRGRVEEVACDDCGDGPLLTGIFAEDADLITTAALQKWLDDTGWTHDTICPRCSATHSSHAAARATASPVPAEATLGGR